MFANINYVNYPQSIYVWWADDSLYLADYDKLRVIKAFKIKANFYQLLTWSPGNYYNYKI